MVEFQEEMKYKRSGVEFGPVDYVKYLNHSVQKGYVLLIKKN